MKQSPVEKYGEELEHCAAQLNAIVSKIQTIKIKPHGEVLLAATHHEALASCNTGRRAICYSEPLPIEATYEISPQLVRTLVDKADATILSTGKLLSWLRHKQVL